MQLVSQFSDINSYLKSLDMKISFKPFDEKNCLEYFSSISKSNQFNLTTKRYSQKELLRLKADESYFTRQVRLEDIFGDNGMICVIICKIDKDAWEIDSWLMSCRVLERKVEVACLHEIVKKMHLLVGQKKLTGRFIPTARNNIVKEHYKKLGFTKVSDGQEGETWELCIQEFRYPKFPIKITSFDKERSK